MTLQVLKDGTHCGPRRTGAQITLEAAHLTCGSVNNTALGSHVSSPHADPSPVLPVLLGGSRPPGVTHTERVALGGDWGLGMAGRSRRFWVQGVMWGKEAEKGRALRWAGIFLVIW